MIFDLLILGGGASGLSAALIFGSAYNKPFMHSKKVGIVAHQKASSLQNALFNNVLGIAPGKLGSDLLIEGLKQLSNLYPEVEIIEKEMILDVIKNDQLLIIKTNKNSYQAKNIIICTGAKRFELDGLNKYKTLHTKLPIEKERIMLKHINNKVDDGIYVAGTLSGIRSQFAIATGSGTSVALDILSEWNNGVSTMIHDKI